MVLTAVWSDDTTDFFGVVGLRHIPMKTQQLKLKPKTLA